MRRPDASPAARHTGQVAKLRVRRVYDEPDAADGARVLVDRVWPRGVRKDDAPWQRWLREVAPSTELRRWYGHDPDRFAEFADRYRAELADDEHADAVAELRALAEDGVTLLTATKDVEHSHAAVLADTLR
jgi:uncharacterized protein YeaO (DUF488 family)